MRSFLQTTDDILDPFCTGFKGLPHATCRRAGAPDARRVERAGRRWRSRVALLSARRWHNLAWMQRGAQWASTSHRAADDDVAAAAVRASSCGRVGHHLRHVTQLGIPAWPRGAARLIANRYSDRTGGIQVLRAHVGLRVVFDRFAAQLTT
jgi:hypothetical protein